MAMELIDHEVARLAKGIADSGAVSSFEAALEQLAALRFHITINPAVAETQAGQAAAITAAATAVRVGATVTTSASNTRLLLPLAPRAFTLTDAMRSVGVTMAPVDPSGLEISIGGPAERRGVRTWIDGWWGGATPGDHPVSDGDHSNPLAGVFSGATAVAMAFRLAQGAARIRPGGLNLWSPGETGGVGGGFKYLPTTLWLVGLGHLGQGYLWSLAVLPYQHPSQVQLVLQDDDAVSKTNWGTSLLVAKGKYGRKKTRHANEWAEALGFNTTLMERRFDAGTRPLVDERHLVLCGLDSLPARRLVCDAGFPLVIDAGLGPSHDDFLKFAVNTFTMERPGGSYWANVEEEDDRRVAELLKLDAYKALKIDDADCGTALLAGKAVATSFVGAAVGAVVIAQALRASAGELLPGQVRGALDELQLFRPSGLKLQSPNLAYADGEE